MQIAKNPPITPALPIPAGHPALPQNGQAADSAYIPEMANHNPKNRKNFPKTGNRFEPGAFDISLLQEQFVACGSLWL